jgi:HK97 family phage prohead protease
MPYFITDSSPDCSGWATIKEDGEVIGCHETKEDAIAQMVAVSIAEDMEPGGERAPAPAKDQIEGSDENKPDSAQGAGGNIDFDEATETSLRNKVKDHNEDMDKSSKPDWTRATLGQLKAVYRRGAGAYSSSHRPGISRAAWAMARVNAYLYLLRNGRPANPKYITDFDLLPKDHPKSTRDLLINSNVQRVLPDNYRPSLTEDVPEGRACGNCIFYKEDDVKEFANGELRAWCEKWDDYVNGAYYCNAWQPAEEIEEDLEDELDQSEKEDDDYEERAINQDAPAYMRAAARRGLELNADGRGGAGLTDKTIREARLMADGQVSDDKWIRIAAWIARHMPDLDAPKNNNPNDPQYPGPGLVAHLLWGSGPSKRAAQRTMKYAEGVVERIRAEEEQARWASVNVQLKKQKEEKMPSKVERRINDVNFEIRVGEIDANKMTFTGYAAVFNSASEPLPFTEYIIPGAFSRSLKSRNEIKLFMNHNTDIVLGSTRAKTLRLSEDSKGLLAEAVLPDTTAGRDLSILMQRGDVNSMSFGFSVPARGDKWSDDGMSRELHQIRLHEVSIVTGFPAYEATTASVRSIDALATRTGMDADTLADALTRLEAGETLSPNHADVIGEAVFKLKESNPSVDDLLEIKRKQLDLLFKAI